MNQNDYFFFNFCFKVIAVFQFSSVIVLTMINKVNEYCEIGR